MTLRQAHHQGTTYTPRVGCRRGKGRHRPVKCEVRLEVLRAARGHPVCWWAMEAAMVVAVLVVVLAKVRVKVVATALEEEVEEGADRVLEALGERSDRAKGARLLLLDPTAGTHGLHERHGASEEEGETGAAPACELVSDLSFILFV